MLSPPRLEVQDVSHQLLLKVPCLLLTDMLPCHDGDDPSGTVSQNKIFKTLLRSRYLITATEKELIQDPIVAAWFANVFSSSVDSLFCCLLYSVKFFSLINLLLSSLFSSPLCPLLLSLPPPSDYFNLKDTHRNYAVMTVGYNVSLSQVKNI